jgi:hypothetical protein
VSGSLGSHSLAGAALGGTFLRARPYVTALTPVGAITAETPTVTWTYSSPVPRAQEQFQVQIRNESGTVILWDSLIEAGDGTTYMPDFRLSGGSTYRIYVRASDGFDWSLDPVTLEDWSWLTFTSETVSAEDFPELESVGSVYEIGINGVGYMLADSPETPVERRTSTLQPPRFTTGDTPFSEAIERYTYLGYSSFKNGAGQLLRSRPESDPSRFWDSHGINPFEDEALQLLHTVSVSQAGSYASAKMAVANGKAYLATASGELKAQDTPGGSTTTFSITGASAPTSMASDGFHWYYADGASIYRNSVAADPSTAWSAVNAELIEWAGDRLVAVYVDAGSPTQRVVSPLAPDGTEETTGGKFKYPSASTTIPAMTSGDGFLWFAVNHTDKSAIHYWRLGSADTYAAVGLELPAGQVAVALGFYLGNVFIKAVQTKTGGGYRNFIYRCIPDEGRLTAELVTTFDTSSSDAPTLNGFAGIGRLVLFNWTEMTTEATPKSGLGAIDLSTGGYSKWLYTASASPVWDVANWNGRAAFLQDGDLFAEDTTYVTSGWLRTSHDDLASTLQKVVDQVSIVTDPLPSDSTIEAALSLDLGASYADVGAAFDGGGKTTQTWFFSRIVRSAGLELTLTGDGSATPKVRHAQARLHPILIADQLLQLPINCADQVAGLNGRSLPVNSPGAGLKRAKTLEALIGTQIKLQDVDWSLTRTSSIWEVVDAQTTTRGVFDKHQNRRVDSAVTVLTLRRPM